jgi:hypothetical protein
MRKVRRERKERPCLGLAAGAQRAGTGTCVGESCRVVGLVRAALESSERQWGPFALFHRHLHHEEAAAGKLYRPVVCGLVC